MVHNEPPLQSCLLGSLSKCLPLALAYRTNCKIYLARCIFRGYCHHKLISLNAWRIYFVNRERQKTPEES